MRLDDEGLEGGHSVDREGFGRLFSSVKIRYSPAKLLARGGAGVSCPISGLSPSDNEDLPLGGIKLYLGLDKGLPFPRPR